ncbi:MAG: AAA family ATPase [Alphaproteobacteria bacterium]|nr:AAA family ATPase [Alphaproteobacteria bacterium]
MTIRPLRADDVGLPRLTFDGAPPAADAFDLSSHARAREALQFGLPIREVGFNIFVMGDDRSGRMTATLAFLAEAVADRGPAGDWVYLNNFRRPHRPKPYQLPTGTGRQFRDRMAALVPRLRESLQKAMSAESVQASIHGEAEKLRGEIARRMGALRADAQAQGLDVVETERGIALMQLPQTTQPPSPDAVARLGHDVEETSRWIAERQVAFTQWRQGIARQLGEQVAGVLLDEAISAFASQPRLARWLTEMRVDLVEHVPGLLMLPPDELPAAFEAMQRRYSVNLLVDHGDESHPPVVVEPNPTYENLFGQIDYKQVQGALSTDFTLIRSGALHRANGGILVLRAEAIAADAELWSFLKAALRDRAIRIEERHRSGGPPIAGAPRPKAVPLDVKVILVGHPRWYYVFFSVDPDFQHYFKIRAEIEPDLPATPANIASYVSMIRRMAAGPQALPVDDGAMARLLGIAARWADDRTRLTARFELMEDYLTEAAAHARGAGKSIIDADVVDTTGAARRRRNGLIEDRSHGLITDGTVLIDVTGRVIGQVNALTVREVGEYSFGAPSRVTARAAMGRRGIINIERDVSLGGPIQQKAAMVIQGWLMGRFARRHPLAFNCSLTFEQNYGGVEGDSASLAELVAILSDVAGVPVRQDIAITGSVNQRGQAQPVGGVRNKVEGFYRTCLDRGALTGTQGVIVPATNARNLILHDGVRDDVAAGRFHLWTVTTIEDAVELMLDMPAGDPDARGDYPADTVYGRVMAQIIQFDERLGRGTSGA